MSTLLNPIYTIIHIVVFLISGMGHPVDKDFKIVAYQKYNTIDHFNPETYSIIDQLIYKLISPKACGGLEVDASTLKNINQLREAKKGHENTTLLIGVGGAKKYSRNFPVLAANPESRARFIRNLIEFCSKNLLDGVDLDWEYPESIKEQSDAVLLFKEMHDAFKAKGLIVTAAINYRVEQIRFAKRIEPYVDQIHLMAYEPLPGLRTFQDQINYCLNSIQEECLKTDKLLLGLPFYGRNLYDHSTMPYNEIIRLKEFNSEKVSDIDYMSPDVIAQNVRCIKSKKLGGVMFWELGFDVPVKHPASLLKSIKDSLNKRY